MSSLALFQALAHQLGGQIDGEGDGQQDQGHREGQVELGPLLGVDVQGHSEGGTGAVSQAAEQKGKVTGGQKMRQSLVVEAAEKVLEGGAHAGGEHEHRRLAHHTADGQDAAGDDAVHGGGEHHGADHVPLAGAQAQGCLPVGLGHRLQGLLCGADDGGDGGDDQRQGAGQQGCLQAQQLAEEQHAHQAEDDGRDAGQGLRCELDGGHQLLVFGVLRQVYGCTHAQGQDDDQRHHHDINGIGDVGQDADGIVDIAGLRAQKLPGDVGQAPDKDVPDDKDQQGAGQRGAEIQQEPEHPVIGPAPAGEGLHSDRFLFHSRSPLFPLQQRVQCNVDDHDKNEQHQRDGEQRLTLQAGGIGHLTGHCGGQEPDAGEEGRHVGHIAGHHDDGHGLADGAADAQHDAGGNAAFGSGHADLEPGLGIGGTQG